MSLFRAEVEGMEAYTLLEPDCPVKVNQNESPWDWPGTLKREALRASAELAFNRYPPFGEEALASALESRWSLPRGSVLVGNGSNELLQALCLAVLGPGRSVLLPSPSFSLYRQLALLASARVREVPMEGGVSYDGGAWLEATRRLRPALALVCSPNNPTGACFPGEALEELLEAAPGLVAVDEAYGEFTEQGAAMLLRRRKNVVILRTFSKAWGCAALRLGYLLAAPETAAQVRKALLPYNLSPLTAELGLFALRNEAYFRTRAKETIRLREALARALARLPGLMVYPSEANFLLIRVTGIPAHALHASLKTRGILVRDVSSQPMLEGCLRVSVGTEEENRAVADAMREVFGVAPEAGRGRSRPRERRADRSIRPPNGPRRGCERGGQP